MYKYKFTFGYSGEHLKFQHNESPRFIVLLKDDGIEILKGYKGIPPSYIEWIDKPPFSRMELA